MFQETSLNKKESGKSLIDSNINIKLRDISKGFILLLAKTNIKYKIVKLNKLSKIKSRPTIYVVNHYSAQDTPISCSIIDERAYILAGKQNLGLLDNLFFYIYGSIFVDRKNKQDMMLSKETMKQYLNKNKSIIMFPEGTWNLSENLLVLNMKWGIIDVASQTQAQIIPICLDYDRDTMECYVKYGDPIVVDCNDNKKEAIDNLRDTMATLRWEMLERQNLKRRSMLDVEIEKEKNNISIQEFPKIDIEYENSVIYEPNDSNEKVFRSVKKLELSKKNMFLFYKNNKGM